ncbi:MAG: hypothetical protein JST68_21455 [Bacteroidetes bacterium]|nr:hypothetical protein [Bacteroidota bacterium]
MRKQILFPLLVLAIIALLVALIAHQNKQASGKHPELDYLSFNRSADGETRQIMRYWREAPERASAVRNIVILDYVLILVYCPSICFLILREIRKKKGIKPRVVVALRVGMVLFILGTLIDVIQDSLIYHFVSSTGPVWSLLWYTIFKWWLLILGVAPLLYAMITPSMVGRISGLMAALWLFFPSLVFIFLTIACFWGLGQGRDILVAFVEPHPAGLINWRLLSFFIVVGFWVYISWYSSRVIALIRQHHQRERGKEDDNPYYDAYPRIAGHACFLVVNLALLQSPLLKSPLPGIAAWGILIAIPLALYFVDKKIRIRLEDRSMQDNSVIKRLRSAFWKIFWTFLALALIACIVEVDFFKHWYLLILLMLLYETVYFFYINLHHVASPSPSSRAYRQGGRSGGQGTPGRTNFQRVMNYFKIDPEEKGYFKWFNILSVAALLFDAAAILFISVARFLGPFTLVLFGFSVLLAFINLVTAFSVKYKVNLHLILLLCAFFIGLNETHKVRTMAMEASAHVQRPSFEQYLRAWLQRVPDNDTSRYNVYFVLSNGGASRSGYWTAAALGRLQDNSPSSPGQRFSDHVFCLSGTSGGGVGVATFYGLLCDKRFPGMNLYERSAKSFLKQDYFSFTAARMLGPDYFNYILHLPFFEDRGAVLENSFEKYSPADNDTLYNPGFKQPFTSFGALDGSGKAVLPVLFVNTTRMQDGNPGLVANIIPDSQRFNRRVDAIGLLDADSSDISLASAAILGARFPYLSPAGKIGPDYFVDGGYFDNSGAGAVQELIRGMMVLGRQDSVVRKRLQRLRLVVLHVLNSPVIETEKLEAVAPIKNDLFAPLVTIVGAYDMQTTVNDGRLRQYLKDVSAEEAIPTEYLQISLYKDAVEMGKDSLKKEPPYSMNWFMSDTTRRRIDQRLDSNPLIQTLSQQFKTVGP